MRDGEDRVEGGGAVELVEERAPLRGSLGASSSRWARVQTAERPPPLLALALGEHLWLESLGSSASGRSLSLPSPVRALACRDAEPNAPSLLLGTLSGDLALLSSSQPRPAWLSASRALSACTSLAWQPPAFSSFAAAFHDGSLFLIGPVRDPSPSCATTRDSLKPPSRLLHFRRSSLTHATWNPSGSLLALTRRDGSVTVLRIGSSPSDPTRDPFENGHHIDADLLPSSHSQPSLHEAKSGASASSRHRKANSSSNASEESHSPLVNEEGGFQCYYGAALCAAWSPDGALLAAGGECDQAELFIPDINGVVAWMCGHVSFVSSLAFIERVEALQESNGAAKSTVQKYRLAGAGHDGQVLLWDIPVDSTAFQCKCRPIGVQPPVRLGNVPTVSPTLHIDAHSSPVASLHLLSDGLLSVSCFGNIKRWRFRRAKERMKAHDCVENDHVDNRDDKQVRRVGTVSM